MSLFDRIRERLKRERGQEQRSTPSGPPLRVVSAPQTPNISVARPAQTPDVRMAPGTPAYTPYVPPKSVASRVGNFAADITYRPFTRQVAQTSVALKRKIKKDDSLMFDPENWLTRLVYGDDPIGGYEGQVEANKSAAEFAGLKGGSATAAAFGMTALGTVLNVAPGGGTAKSTVKKIAQSTDPKEIFNILKGVKKLKLDDKAMTTLSSQLVNVTDPKDVQNIFSRLSEAQRVIQGGEKALTASKVGKVTLKAGEKERGLITSMKGAKLTSVDVKKAIKGTYKPITNKATLKAAQKVVDDVGIDTARQKILQTQNLTADDVAVGLDLVRRLQNVGRTDDAIDLIENLAPKATSLGQAIQAFAMWSRLTPEGSLRAAQRLVDRANATRGSKQLLRLNTKKADRITELAKQIQKLPEGRAKTLKTAELVEEIHSVVPPSMLTKVSTIQTMAQLINPKTFMRNIIGNAGFFVAEQSSDLVGAGVDAAVGVFTGKRSKVAPSLRTQSRGFALGLREGVEEALLRVNLNPDATSIFDLPRTRVFEGKVGTNLERLLSLELRAPDRAFYKAAYEGSLENQMRATRAKVPTDKMKEVAHYDALYRTFQDENVATRLFKGIKNALNLGKDFGLGDIILKYPKTPANLLMRGIDYSPVGFFKSVYEAAAPLIKGTDFNQKAFVESFSRAFVGSGTIAAGYILHEANIISGRAPEDKDLNASQRLAGLGQYKINTDALIRFVMSGGSIEAAKPQEGDNLVTYDWFQPNAVSVSMGANIAEKGGLKASSAAGTLLGSLQEGVETLADQPLVTGLARLAQGDSIVEGLGRSIVGAPSSFVPSMLNQANQFFDKENVYRETYSENPLQQAYNMTAARIPGLAQTLPVQNDVLGRPRERYQDGSNTVFNVFFSPAIVTKFRQDPVIKEVLDIYGRTGETKQAPRIAERKITINGERRALTGQEISQYQQYIGTRTNALFQRLISQPGFAELPDAAKVKAMSGLMTDINAAAKIELFGDRPRTVDGGTRAILALGRRGTFNSPLPTPSASTVQPKSTGPLDLAAAQKALASTRGKAKRGRKVRLGKLPKAPKPVKGLSKGIKTKQSKKTALPRTRVALSAPKSERVRIKRVDASSVANQSTQLPRKVKFTSKRRGRNGTRKG